MNRIIQRDRSVIPACDVDNLANLGKLVEATHDIEGIGGYKIGFELALSYGLPRVVETIRKFTEKPIIYDHQKAGTDIPDTGKAFARLLRAAKVDAAILFPQAGPATEEAWIKALQDEGLGVIVGGIMTHRNYLTNDGGFIESEGALRIYQIAADLGVRDFVVPGNQPETIGLIRKVLGNNPEHVFYAPGFITQGGELSEAAKVAGSRFHPIVGRALYESQDPRTVALGLTSKL